MTTSIKKMQSNHTRIKKAHRSYEKDVLKKVNKMDDKTLRRAFAKVAALASAHDELFRHLMQAPEVREYMVGDKAAKDMLARYQKMKKQLK